MTRLCLQYLAIYRNKNLGKIIYIHCAKVSWKLCPRPNKPEIHCQRFLNIRQGVVVSPNLVTLLASDVFEGKLIFPMIVMSIISYSFPPPLMNIYFFNGPNPASLFIFVLFYTQWQKFSKNVIREDGVLGIRTRDHRMIGADESTEIWLFPCAYLFFYHLGSY